MTYSTLGTDTETGQPVYLYKSSRTQGLYVIGAPGTGKSGMLSNIIVDDGKQGTGFCVIDPHGELIQTVIARLPVNREKDVILLDIHDYHYPFGLNLFACFDPTNPIEVQKIVDKVMHVFDKLLAVTPDTPLIRQYLRNCTYTLVANPGFTMSDMLLLLTDKHFRQQLVSNITDPQVRLFWKQYDMLSSNVQEERASSLQRRVEEFLQPLTINIVGQSASTINLQEIMDTGKILLVKLDVLQLEAVSKLIGSLIIALFLLAASTRRKRDLFNIYVDEFQRFATEDFATFFAEARKFGIGLTVAHQFRDQLDTENKGATLTAANMIVFRVSSIDADELAGQFKITPQDAYDEVLKEEWVETTKEEWFEPKVDIIEDGQEEIKETRTDVVEWAIHSTNPFLVEFFKPWQETLQDAHMRINEGETPDTTYGRGRHSFTRFGSSWSNRDRVEEAKKRLDAMNTLLYRAMTTKTFQVVPLPLLRWMRSSFIFVSTYVVKTSRGDMDLPMRGADYLCFLEEFDRKGIVIPPSREGIAAYERLWTVPDSQLSDAFRAYERIARSLLGNYLKVFLDYYLESNPPINEETLAHLNKSILVREKDRELKEYQITGVQDIPRSVEMIIAKRKPSFEQFVRDFRKVMALLIQDPPQKGTGQYKPHQRTQIHYLTHPRETITHPRKVIHHPKRLYADVKLEMSNQLVGLPDYTARVRLKDDTEHIIKTIKPAPGLYSQHFQDRIDRILAHNRAAGYTRPRHDVEDEIVQRQSQYLQQAQQPHKPQQPQGRKIPVCPSCGANNQQGDRFCAHCGAKL